MINSICAGRPWYRCLALLMLLGGGARAAPAAPVDYVLDPGHSWVQFELLHFGTSTIRGRLGPAQGVVSLDPASGSGEISIELDTTTLSTGWSVFDARIRRADLLATDEYPRSWFVSRNVRLDPRGGVQSVTGELTLRGTSLPLRLDAERFACQPDAATGRQRCGGDFVGRLRRSDAGMHFGLPFVGDEVTLRIQVEAVGQPAGSIDRP